MNSLEIIEKCRRSFGEAPRNLSPLQHFYLNVRAPQWLEKQKDDPLWSQFRARPTLYKYGRVVWSHLIQVNRLMFEPGSVDSPSEVVYSPDAFFLSNPRALEQLGHELYSLKNTQPDHPELRAFADDITNEMTRTLRRPIPKMMTGGRDVYHTSLLFHRAHLPQGFISNGYFPLIICPERVQEAVTLPSRFWPKEYAESWRR